MTISHRLSVIALKKFDEHPQERAPAVRMLLRNAVRLGIAHLGRKEAIDLMSETLRERDT